MEAGAENLLSFDDLLSQTAQAVTSETEGGVALRKSLGDAFDAAMIDEFQDTDPVQFKIFQELFGKEKKHWLYLIGDPKQSIYRFRGRFGSLFRFREKNQRSEVLARYQFPDRHAFGPSGKRLLLKSQNPFLHDDLPFEVKPGVRGARTRKRPLKKGEIFRLPS